MLKKISLFLFLSLSFTLFCQAQSNPTPNPTPTKAESIQNDEKEIIRISSNLVLVDALVLDKQGKQVTDLSAEDFEILQDGKPQEIVNFAYLSSGKTNAIKNEKNVSKKKDKNALPVPPISLHSNQGRMITFVVDDGNPAESPISLELARDAMQKFIDNQMLPDDKVAIYRTRSHSSLMQLYTSNKEVLRRIVDKIYWLPDSPPEIDNDDSAPDRQRSGNGQLATASSKRTSGNQADIESKKIAESSEQERNVYASIGTMSFVIERLKNLPQRKVIFFISTGYQLSSISKTALQDVADRAIRASVVIYPISDRGVTNPAFIDAEDRRGIQDENPAGTSIVMQRIDTERALNNSLEYLAYQTGGDFIRNKNYLDTGIRDVLNKETGYYLIGYQPNEETFKGKNFHDIKVRLKRPDLKVVSRKGFFSSTDETEAKNKNRTAQTPLYQAIASPLRENGIALRLTTLVENNAKDGNLIRALFHVDGKDLILTDATGGAKKIVLDVVGVTLDESGKVVEEFSHTYPIQIPQQGVQTVAQSGLDYSTTIPIKKPGFYSFRMAVRDNNSRHLGSAGDFVEIPDLSKGNLFVSGLVTTTITNDGKPLQPKDRPASAAFIPVFINSIPSIRQYRPGDILAYTYQIYNAKLNPSNSQPQLTTQIRLYKNGKIIVEGQETAAQLEAQSDTSRIADYGLFRLAADAEIGEYILQIIVKDQIANKVASQWIDFEVIK